MAGELIVETWLPIADYVGLYEVSDHGRVRSLERYRSGFRGASTRVPARILQQGGSRYPMVVLSKEGRQRGHSVHRLVAEAFIPSDESRPEVNHRDGNQKNNHVQNLEWVTHSENVKHAYRTVGRRGWERAV